MRELIDALVRSAERESMELYGVHIYRRGAEPVERRLRSDDRVDVHSVAKTFTSVALGIAEAEGRLALDDPALKYYPELAGSAAPGLDQVTLRHLLMMTSGSPYSWDADDPVVVPDLAADFFATPLAHEPGTHFRYTDIGPYVAARALRAATGANVRDYLLPRVFTPLAIHNPPVAHLSPRPPGSGKRPLPEDVRTSPLRPPPARRGPPRRPPTGPRRILRTNRDRNRPDRQGPDRRRLPPLGQLRPRCLVHPRGNNVQNGRSLRPALHNLPG